MNGSRLFSVRYGGKINIGRVQTPTLAMIVRRDDDVKNFVKQKYFTVNLECDGLTLSSERMQRCGSDHCFRKTGSENGKPTEIL